MLIVGIDEVGRGPLAGPVVACAAIMPEGFNHPGIMDSKKVSEKKLESLYSFLSESSVEHAFGVVCSSIIDSTNILRATKQAMHIALSKLKTPYDKIIVDAVKLNNVSAPLEHPFRGEEAHINVAAASMLAKVYRDRLMKKLHMHYPEYHWYSNKGYGAKVHIEAIKKFGLTPLHRVSFCQKILGNV